MQEEIAKIVFESMVWAVEQTDPVGRHIPRWVEGGNSHAQVEARVAASKIMDLAKDTKS